MVSARWTLSPPQARCPSCRAESGHIPPFSVVVPGTLPDPNGGPSLACAVIVKTVDAGTRAKTGINDLLRD